jgi:hypothetical protein
VNAAAEISGRGASRLAAERGTAEHVTADGKYLYAIIADAGDRKFKARGIGERGDVVYTVSHRRLSAVVSDSPFREYENSRRNMMAHTVVLEEVMTEFDLLPVRFGTVAASAEKIVSKLLMPRYEEFTTLVEQMRGRIELGLKAFWHEGVAFEEVVRENETVRKLRAMLQGRSLEETYYERIRLGEEVEKTLNDIRIRDEENILSRLRSLSEKTKSNKIVSDRMVLNAVFLIKRDRAAEFDEAVRKLDADFCTRLMFKYVGPVPPYNFVNIVVNWEE